MLRPRSNCTVICVVPNTLEDVSWATPGMAANWYSSGVATADAIVSGLAPGNFADTWMVGKSTCGNGATGSNGNATIPSNKIPAINRDVAIGRLMNGSEILTARPARPVADWAWPIHGQLSHGRPAATGTGCWS